MQCTSRPCISLHGLYSTLLSIQYNLLSIPYPSSSTPGMTNWRPSRRLCHVLILMAARETSLNILRLRPKDNLFINRKIGLDRVTKWVVVLLSVTSYCCVFSRQTYEWSNGCLLRAGCTYSSVASTDEAHLHAAREERIAQTSYNVQLLFEVFGCIGAHRNIRYLMFIYIRWKLSSNRSRVSSGLVKFLFNS
jgi:hypothetical protein